MNTRMTRKRRNNKHTLAVPYKRHASAARDDNDDADDGDALDEFGGLDLRSAKLKPDYINRPLSVVYSRCLFVFSCLLIVFTVP